MPRIAGPEGVKSATVTIRLTPKMRFGLELMARRHHDSVQEIMQRAINDLFASTHEGLLVDLCRPEDEVAEGLFAPVNILNAVWSESAAERLANLALLCPELLNTPERRIWAKVRENDRYWKADEGSEARKLDDLDVEKLEEDWLTLITDVGK